MPQSAYRKGPATRAGPRCNQVRTRLGTFTVIMVRSYTEFWGKGLVSMRRIVLGGDE
jgi:hypothetical protein